jgi:hypothetical protein
MPYVRTVAKCFPGRPYGLYDSEGVLVVSSLRTVGLRWMRYVYPTETEDHLESLNSPKRRDSTRNFNDKILCLTAG